MRVLGVDPGMTRCGIGVVDGAPGRALSLVHVEVVRTPADADVGDRLVLVSVGGVETADDAWERILAGATLVQGYTGFVYGGPLWPWRVNRGLGRRTSAGGQRGARSFRGASVPDEGEDGG